LPSHDELYDSKYGTLDSSALLGGCRNFYEESVLIDECGYWWLATIRNEENEFNICRNDNSFCYFDVILRNIFNKAGHSVRCVRRNYGLDINFAMLIKKETKKILYFKDYENYLDSLLTSKYETVLSWCTIMEKSGSELKKHYLEKNPKKDFFLQYYDERCIKPIKEFVFSTTGVDFFYKKKERGRGGKPRIEYSISIIRTEIGAFAEYSFFNAGELELLQAEFSMKEWQDFIETLYNCCITKWRNFEDSSYVSMLSIYSLNKETLKYRNDEYYTLPNLDIFKEVMYDMEIKIRKRAGAEIRERPW
jgi:hypothetical protein